MDRDLAGRLEEHWWAIALRGVFAVIFGLLVGFEINGLIGALIALPILAAVNATWSFFSERLVFEPWTGGGTIPVEVELADQPTEPKRPRALDG